MSAYNSIVPSTTAARPPAARAPLDPDWDELRRAGAALWNELVDDMERLGERPVWRPTPADVKARLSPERPLPATGQGLTAALADLSRDVLAYPYGNTHPRFWGWVNGSGLPAGILGDLAASAMNANTGAFDHAAVHVEHQVLGWLKEFLDLDPHSDGLLTSGGSMANLHGLAAAQVARSGLDVRRRGLAGAPQRTVYASCQTHFSVDKALELMGIGSDHLRRLPVDGEHRLDLAALEQALRADRRAGFHPLAVVGNAGTVNTGATDDLEALADLCARERLWLHVDGAFGAVAWIVPELRGPLRGLQRADSIAFDLHKWFYVPSDIGCVMVRDPEALPRAFAFSPAYLTPMRGGIAKEERAPFKDRGLELTRRSRGLKAWMAFKVHGREGFVQAVRANIEQAQYLAREVAAHPELELAAPAPLNIVCYRFVAPGLEPALLNLLNAEILVRLQESGTAVPSHTTLDGTFALRVANTNHRTTEGDFDVLVAATVRFGHELLTELDAPTPPAWTQDAH